ncbi:MAG: kelch repeat-containing protein [Bacteroidia bacterium]
MKNHLLHTLIFLLLWSGTFAQAGMWTWMNGDSVPNSLGVFGTQGVPSPLNHPPAVYEPAEFTDLQGNFWLFGGTDVNQDEYSDLWKYDPLINQWTWVKGTSLPNYPGYYGIKGVPSINNLPPTRAWGTASWVDLNGDFWIYGGFGFYNSMNDFWKYHIATNTWTWMHGSTIPNQPPVYGVLGIPDTSNTPGSRYECNATWVDGNNLWLLGGFTSSTAGYATNTLWKYDQLSNQWTWMKGSSTPNDPGNYGTKGVPSFTNLPRARAAYCHWKDNNGNFWFLGGQLFQGYILLMTCGCITRQLISGLGKAEQVYLTIMAIME